MTDAALAPRRIWKGFIMNAKALALSLVALASAPSLAQEHAGQATHYNSSSGADGRAPTLAGWSATLSRSLGAAMRYPHFFSNEVPADGTARVRFVCSPSGVPAGLELVRSSGNVRIDGAALAALRRIKTMHPLPLGVSPDQHYVAAIVFAASQESLDRQLRAIRKEQLAHRSAGSSDIALLLTPGRVRG